MRAILDFGGFLKEEELSECPALLECVIVPRNPYDHGSPCVTMVSNAHRKGCLRVTFVRVGKNSPDGPERYRWNGKAPHTGC